MHETDFMKGIIFEENPFENESPEQTLLFSREGEEVTMDETK